MYYERYDVQSILLLSANSTMGMGVRESAIYNSRIQSIQRYERVGNERKPIRLTPESILQYVAQGAQAFYISYWYYAGGPEQPVGRDLVWTVRPQKGGLKISKRITKLIVQALRSLGIEPWVKYDGQLGFDIIVPLAYIPYECWFGNLQALDDLHHKLTDYIASTIVVSSDVSAHALSPSSLQLESEAGICLLSELRVRRGLLLAPMSLNPRTNLVSVPVNPDELDSFTVLQATPPHVRPVRWTLPPAPVRALTRFALTTVPVQTTVSEVSE